MASSIRVPKVFVDSSVLFAAVYSATGSARDLLLAASQGRVLLVFSDDVLDETERNLLASAPRAHAAFLQIRNTIPYELSHTDSG